MAYLEMFRRVGVQIAGDVVLQGTPRIERSVLQEQAKHLYFSYIMTDTSKLKGEDKRSGEEALAYAKKFMTEKKGKSTIIEQLEKTVNLPQYVEYMGYFRKAKAEGNYARLMLLCIQISLKYSKDKEYGKDAKKLKEGLDMVAKLSISLDEVKKQLEAGSTAYQVGKPVLEYGIVPTNNPGDSFHKNYGDERIRNGVFDHYHAGIDQMRIKEEGEKKEVYNDHIAPVSGLVLRVGEGDEFTGLFVEILGIDGIRYWSCHHDALYVKAGDCVKGGQRIAKIGSTGVQESGPHIHFEIRTQNGVINPATTLEQVYRVITPAEFEYLKKRR